ncbi:MAG: WD40 repeat domain-containing protein [Planctomycetes bacterium]|nr:WD40 repeat domain-containing protein [Planctomycetota bacterium]
MLVWRINDEDTGSGIRFRPDVQLPVRVRFSPEGDLLCAFGNPNRYHRTAEVRNGKGELVCEFLAPRDSFFPTGGVWSDRGFTVAAVCAERSTLFTWTVALDDAEPSFRHTFSRFDGLNSVVFARRSKRCVAYIADLHGLFEYDPSENGKTIAFRMSDSRYRVLQCGLLVQSCDGRRLAAGAVVERFSPKSRSVAQPCERVFGAVAAWDTSTRKLTGILGRWSETPSTLAFAANRSPILAVGSYDGIIRVYEVASGTRLKAWKAHRTQVSSLVFVPSLFRCVSAGEDATVKLWDLAGAVPKRLVGE